MARVPLSQLPDWKVVDEGQEIRGLRLEDETGNVLGLIADLIVDEDAGYVDAVVLDTGQEISAHDIEIGQNVVVLRGPTPPQAASAAPHGEQVNALRLPVVEESLRVGKRQREGGGIRVTTEVEEVPVREEVAVRHETVDVRRTPVHRPADQREIGEAFQEGVFEVRARAEQIAVSKQLFVVEEIHIDKGVVERTETIQDTVRRTRVDVEELPGEAETSLPGQQNTI